MSNIPNSIHFSQLEQQLKLAERSKKDLIEFLNVSKGKILTLIKTVFSFISDKSLLKKESLSSFNKYTIESKLVQTMSKAYDFYISNFPENGRETLHNIIKERYLKFIKFFEQNENCFFDTETTGLKKNDHVVELGAHEIIDGKLTGGQFHIYIKPRLQMEEIVIRIHQITNNYYNDFYEDIYQNDINSMYEVINNWITYKILIWKKMGNAEKLESYSEANIIAINIFIICPNCFNFHVSN